MAKQIQSRARKAVKTVARKARAGRCASVMKPEYLAEIERMRLMDDDFMSKCLENAPKCIELMLQIILGKKDLKVVKSQTEYPIKSLQGRGVRFDVFARDSKGREYDIEMQRADKGAEPKRARYNSALMDAEKALEDSTRLLEEGLNLVIFPEGTRIPPDAPEHRLNRGAAHLALSSGAPLVACRIEYDPPVLGKTQPWWDVGEREIVVRLSYRGAIAAEGESNYRNAVALTERIGERIFRP